MSSIKKLDHLFGMLPNPKTESWKYTNIKKFLPNDLLTTVDAEYKNLDSKTINKNILSVNSPFKMWFKNDHFDKQESILPKGVSVKKISPNNVDHSGFYFNENGDDYNDKIIPSKLFKNQEEHDNFLKINNQAHKNCYLIEFERGFNCNEFIEINSLFNSLDSGLNQQRLLFLIHPKANVKLLEQVFDHSNKTNLHHSVSEFICLKGSLVEHVWVQQAIQNSCTVKTNYTIQKNSSQTNFYNLSLNGKMIRNNYHVNLLETSSSTKIHGFSCIKNSDHIDNYINVMHSAEDCKSSQLFKNLFTDNSSGVFVGGIYVDKDSQKTEAYQQNDNILLSEGAQIDAIPKLEIFADDVMCSHGCTIGQPDVDAIFYLQSRGISKKDAQALLNFAFLNDTFKDISCDKLKNIIIQLVSKQLNLKNNS